MRNFQPNAVLVSLKLCAFGLRHSDAHSQNFTAQGQGFTSLSFKARVAVTSSASSRAARSPGFSKINFPLQRIFNTQPVEVNGRARGGSGLSCAQIRGHAEDLLVLDPGSNGFRFRLRPALRME